MMPPNLKLVRELCGVSWQWQHVAEVSNAKIAPFLALMGGLWGVFCELLHPQFSVSQQCPLFVDHTLKHLFNTVYHTPIIGNARHKLDHELTKNTLFRALTGELWSVFYDYFEDRRGFTVHFVHVLPVQAKLKSVQGFPSPWKLAGTPVLTAQSRTSMTVPARHQKYIHGFWLSAM